MKILILALLISVSTFAGPSDGMLESLPISHVQDNDYLGFQSFRAIPRAPFAGRILINGERPGSMDDIFKVFSEEVAALLPEGTTIKESTNSDGKIVWRYPVGTKVIHQLNFKDDKKSLFELRMVERVSNKRWAYGTYQPKEGELRLRHYKSPLAEEYQLRTTHGKDLNIKLNHIPLQVCQSCHARTTSAPHQYNSPEDVGPCEFTPVNPKVKNDWVKAFVEAYGRQPVIR